MSRIQKLNRFLLILMIGVFSICSVGMILMLMCVLPKRPVFLQHYMEVSMPEEEEDFGYNPLDALVLEYISKTTDSRRVSSLVFEEAKNLSVWVQSYQQNEFLYTVNSTGQLYKTTKIQAVIDPASIADPLKPLLLENATVTLSDGTSYSVNLGKIYLYPREERTETLRMSSGYSNTANEYGETVEVTEPVIVKKIGFHMENDEIRDYTLWYNDIDITNTSESLNDLYQANSEMKLSMQYPVHMEKANYDYYSIAPYIEYEKQNGKTERYQVAPNSCERYFDSTYDYISYFLKRGGK